MLEITTTITSSPILLKRILAVILFGQSRGLKGKEMQLDICGNL